MNLPVKASAPDFLQSLKDMGTTGYWSGQNVDTWIELYNEYQTNPAKYPGGIATVGSANYALVENDVLKQLLGSNVPQFQNNFSLSGGSEKNTYRISLGTVNENGIIAPESHSDKYKRYNVKSVVSSDVTNWFTAQLDAGYFNSLQSSPFNNGFADAVNFPVLVPVTSTLTSATGVVGINGTPENIVLNGGNTSNQNSDIRLTGRGILKPLTGLTITGEYTYDNLTNDQESYNKLINVVKPTNFQVQSNNGTGIYQQYKAVTAYKAINIFANYAKSFADHNFSILGGYNQEENTIRSTTVGRNGMIAINLPSLSQGTGPISTEDGFSSYALQGYFGRLNYDYKSKYLMQLNGRYDGSSNFPESQRFGFFPSGSIGWMVSEEAFMKKLMPGINELKLRASLGQVGNQNITPYSYLATLNNAQPQWLNGTGSYLTSLTTPGIISSGFTWEKVQTLDYGVDITLFSRRLTGSFDWYQRDTKDILAAGAIPLPAVLGTGAPLQNTASLRSTGYEIQLNWAAKIGENLTYRIGANLYDYTAKVTKFEGNPTNLLSTYYVGQQIGEIWGYTTERFYTTDDFVEGSLNANLQNGTLKPGITKTQGENPNPGDIKFVDLNGDGEVNPGAGTKENPGDRTIIGNNAARYQFGFNGGISYKNFDFNFVLRGVAKRDMWLANVLTFPNSYAFGPVYAHQLNYWTPARTDAFYGRIYDQAAGNQNFNQSVQTKYMNKGSYLQVSNLSLAYSAPKSLISKAYISSLRVFCSVENPFMFSHLPDGLDPSLSDMGYGMGYPYLRKVSFGVNLTL